MQDIQHRAAKIRLVIFDVDGVLTDGRLYFGDDGQEYKAFHARDGHGMKLLQDSGVEIAIITGRTSKVVEHRMNNLGIKHVYQGQQKKLPAFEKIIAELHLKPEQVAYVGDDTLDLPILSRAGLAIAVQDAHDAIKPYTHWQTPSPGGRGAARDVCDLIMKAQQTYDASVEHYLA